MSKVRISERKTNKCKDGEQKLKEERKRRWRAGKWRENNRKGTKGRK